MSLKLINIHKEYQHVLFDQLNYQFSSPGFYLLTGKSGSGKTTLLNIIAGYEKFQEGERIIDSDMTIACVFQNYEFIENLTMRENIYMPLDIYDEEYTDAKEIIKILDIESLLDHYPHELSDGQKQRAGIARALFCKPQIIICDEPTESLDIENKHKVIDLLCQMSKHCIVIVASHEKDIMQKYCDVIIEIENYGLKEVKNTQKAQSFIIQPHQRKINLHKAQHFIWKMTMKRNILMVLFFMIFIMIQVGLYQVEQVFFNQKPGTDALNNQVIYIDFYQNNSSLDNLDIVPQFDPLYLSNQYYQCHIYPQPSQFDNPQIPVLKDNEIIINHNVEQLLKKQGYDPIIGTVLSLSYKLENISYPLDFKIIDIVEEKDVGTSLQIYYSKDYMIQTLKSRPYSKKYPSQYDYLTEAGQKIAIYSCNKENVQEQYEYLSNQEHLSIYHSILTSFENSQKSQNFYLLILRIIEITVLIFHILYTIGSILKEMKKNQFGFSLMNAVGLSLKDTKTIFFSQKIKIVIILSLFPIIHILIGYTFNIPIQLPFIYLLSSMIFYLIIFVIRLKTFHKQNIALILKEKED